MMNRKEETKSKRKEIKGLKELKLKFSKLSMGKKVQVIAASFLTLALLIILPVYAWFALSGKIEAFTRIKEPDKLDIRAGHYDPAKYFSLNDIDIEEMITSGKPHRVVFSVSAGDYKIPYQIQLAHTTNIPFKYEIYRATEYVAGSKGAPENPDVTYVSTYTRDQGETNYTFLYTKGTKIDLTPVNPDTTSTSHESYGRLLALGYGDYYNDTYANDDEPEVYAVPIYEQSGRIPYDSTSAHDYFILEISWDSTADLTGSFSEWNAHENKKETDMIYLTASRFSNQ